MTPARVIANVDRGDGPAVGNELAARILRQLHAAGFVIVPREPTEAMIEAGWDADDSGRPTAVYRAMLAAAEEKPT